MVKGEPACNREQRKEHADQHWPGGIQKFDSHARFFTSCGKNGREQPEGQRDRQQHQLEQQDNPAHEAGEEKESASVLIAGAGVASPAEREEDRNAHEGLQLCKVVGTRNSIVEPRGE